MSHVENELSEKFNKVKEERGASFAREELKATLIYSNNLYVAYYFQNENIDSLNTYVIPFRPKPFNYLYGSSPEILYPDNPSVGKAIQLIGHKIKLYNDDVEAIAVKITKNDDLVKDMKIPELEQDIAQCGSICFFSGCEKTIETEAVDTRRDYDSSQSSETSTIASMLGSGLSLNPLPVKQDRGSYEEKIAYPEMSTVVSRTSDLKEREALERASKLGSGKNVFFDLYFQICNAENLEEDAHFEVIINYLFFGEGLEKRLIQYNHLEEHEAQKKINNEVKDQLPKEINIFPTKFDMMNSIVLVVAHCTPKVSGDGKLCCDEVEEVGVEEEVEEGTGRVYVDIKVVMLTCLLLGSADEKKSFGKSFYVEPFLNFDLNIHVVFDREDSSRLHVPP
ncbi:hypothetical protein C1646_760937 [Rhizophagus diaphanus]|nr:hypothetical protein C1646_760937 [Rhizophagus diaphanus] [Rhizophagus sp. MUCL 43196]